MSLWFLDMWRVMKVVCLKIIYIGIKVKKYGKENGVGQEDTSEKLHFVAFLKLDF